MVGLLQCTHGSLSNKLKFGSAAREVLGEYPAPQERWLTDAQDSIFGFAATTEGRSHEILSEQSVDQG